MVRLMPAEVDLRLEPALAPGTAADGLELLVADVEQRLGGLADALR